MRGGFSIPSAFNKVFISIPPVDMNSCEYPFPKKADSANQDFVPE